jgi:hypothetical protein
MKVSTRGAVATAAAMMIVGAGSLAYAKSAPLAPVPGPDGVIHACYDTKDDDPHPYFLRKASCGKKETQIDWNVQGVKGDKGDKGDQGIQGIQGIQGVKGDKGDNGDKGDKGDKGDAGAAGTSAGYAAHTDASGTIGGQINVVSLQLPAGKYILNGTIDVENRDTDDDRTVGCSLADDKEYTILPDMDGSFPFNQVIALTSGFDAGNGATVSIQCTPVLQNNTTWFTGANITAVKVDTLN